MHIVESFLIWSYQHNSWWRPRSYGYTKNIHEAGKYNYEQANDIVEGANCHLRNGDALEETYISSIDIEKIQPPEQEYR